MKEVKITNLIKLYTLLLLLEGPKHGYELIKRVSEKMKRKVSAGEIYPFLKLLKSAGYVEIKIVKRRKVYLLTKKGRVFLEKVLNKLNELLDFLIKPKIVSCRSCGCEIYKGGYKERIKGKLLYFCCYNCAKFYMKSKK